ncbi:MAG: carboxymuconolactone decarboxylase family protein [Phycisphaerae bacterium]|jgi:AhpD family alkylhydroperoxidase|nr:carboxymuconolactone decarboxylase family protein [Phycisphaerae bacterium]
MRVSIQPDQLQRAFSVVSGSSAFAESARLVAAGKRPVEMLQAMSLRPEILQAFAATSEAIYPGGVVERRVKELIILEASRHNRCQFCTESHISIAKMMGITDPAGDPLALLDAPSLMNERERLAVEYTRAAQRDANRIPGELFEALRSAYSDAEIVELTAMIGLISMLNLFNNALQVTYHGEYGR